MASGQVLMLVPVHYENRLTVPVELLSLPMLRLLLSKAQGRKDFLKPLKPCHVGIHWKALAEKFQMSTHLQGFQLTLQVFCIILYLPN